MPEGNNDYFDLKYNLCGRVQTKLNTTENEAGKQQSGWGYLEWD